MTRRVRELNDHERVDVQRIAGSHTLEPRWSAVPRSLSMPWTA